MPDAGRIVAVCLSGEKGTKKTPVAKGLLVQDFGLEGDAHAGTPNRQVSLLFLSSIDTLRLKMPGLAPGDFAENLTLEGGDWRDLPVGTRLRLQRGPLIEITQVGKECHTGCAIREATGDCVMPREGLFACVVEGGEVRPRDTYEVISRRIEREGREGRHKRRKLRTEN
jgi:MOSC domain-containing protein YiiM